MTVAQDWKETCHDNWNFISKNGDILSLKFERAGFSDHMVPENWTKYYFIQHFRQREEVKVDFEYEDVDEMPRHLVART